MSKHLKDFHGNAAKQETPHPGVKADTRQDVVDKLNEVVGKIKESEKLKANDLNTLCEILYLAEARGLGRLDC